MSIATARNIDLAEQAPSMENAPAPTVLPSLENLFSKTNLPQLPQSTDPLRDRKEEVLKMWYAQNDLLVAVFPNENNEGVTLATYRGMGREQKLESLFHIDETPLKILPSSERDSSKGSFVVALRSGLVSEYCWNDENKMVVSFICQSNTPLKDVEYDGKRLTVLAA